MKTQDLRIDNYLEFKGKIVQIDLIDKYDNIGHSGNCYPICMQNPIPLAEEWLLKLGFEDDENGWFIKENPPLIMSWNQNDKTIRCFGYSFSHIYYVHQLQNLYFALTGEELTLNP